MSLELTVTLSSSGSRAEAPLNDNEIEDSLECLFRYSSRLTSDDVSDRLGPS